MNGVDEQTHLRLIAITLGQRVHIPPVAEERHEPTLHKQPVQGVHGTRIQPGWRPIEFVRPVVDRMVIGNPAQLRTPTQGLLEHVTKGCLRLTELAWAFGAVDEEKTSAE